MKRSQFLISAAPAATGLAVIPAQRAGAATDPPAALATYGRPSPYEHNVVRRSAGSTTLAFTPLDKQIGTTTPSGLAYVRNHAEVPNIDPAHHRLLVHGLVERPLTFSVADLMRFPAVEREHFLECSGNSARGWQSAGSGIQFSHGLLQGARWTGVPVRALLEEAGVRSDARWAVAEGADGAHFDRSIPLEKLLDDALLVYGQNGEMLRPEQGYPLRLLLPGFEGSTNVKWLRRLKLVSGPVYSREETAEYSQVLPDGKIHIFDFVMPVKSVITAPAPGERIEPGYREGRGLAWSGHGIVTKVDISMDGGTTWFAATLDRASAKNLTRFTFPIRWNGSPLTVTSRAVDESGAIQPTLNELLAVRGPSLRYHVNTIARWSIANDGRVSNLDA